MPIYVSENRTDYTPAPEGLHHAVCVDVVDRGMQPTTYGDKHQVRIFWQIEAIDPENDRPFQVMRQFTASLNEKASLRKSLEAWRGRKFTQDELKQFDIEKLVGANCQIQLVHNLSDEGKTWCNVQAIVPPPKGATPLIARDYVRAKDRAATSSNGGSPKPAAEDDVPF